MATIEAKFSLTTHIYQLRNNFIRNANTYLRNGNPVCSTVPNISLEVTPFVEAIFILRRSHRQISPKGLKINCKVALPQYVLQNPHRGHLLPVYYFTGPYSFTCLDHNDHVSRPLRLQPKTIIRDVSIFLANPIQVLIKDPSARRQSLVDVL